MRNLPVRRLLPVLLLPCLALLYALWLECTGVFLPCPFRLVTGLLCPGCGVSHLCLALLHLDLTGAWQANPGLFCALPALAVLLGEVGYRTLRGGEPPSWESPLAWLLAAQLLVWGVVRNVL